MLSKGGFLFFSIDFYRKSYIVVLKRTTIKDGDINNQHFDLEGEKTNKEKQYGKSTICDKKTG